MNAQEKAKAYLTALWDKEQIEKCLKEANKILFVQQQELFDAMQAESVDAITIDGVMLSTIIDQEFRIKGHEEGYIWDQMPQWFDWLRGIGEGDIIKMRESVHWATRKKFLKDWVSAGKALPEWIQESFVNRIKVNK